MTGTLHTGAFTAIGGGITGTASRTFGERATDIINVKDFGALGNWNGTTGADDTTSIQAAANAAFGTSASPHGLAGATTNRILFFPPGWYRTTSPITLTDVCGGVIMGSGRFVTEIENRTANGPVFVTNGFYKCVVSQMKLTSNGTGICFDLDWDGTGLSLQSNSFRDMEFNAGAYGCRIGASGNQGSENLFLNCFFNGNTVGGLVPQNANALQNAMIGGNCQSCDIGVYVGSGSVPVIHNVGFQGSTTFDIQVNNSAYDAYSVVGCRSESPNFAKFQNGSSAHLSSNSQISATAGVFAFTEASPGGGAGAGLLILDGNISQNGTITGNGTVYIRGNPVAPMAITNAVNNGSGLVRITVPSTTGITTGRSGIVSGVGGVPGANGSWRLTVISGTQLDLQSTTFSGTYTSGGLLTGGAFYNTGYLSSFAGVVAQNI